jgi:hypothetical protein
VLSLLGAAKDLLQPKHTMRDFNWMEDKQDTEGATLIKTLRNDLNGHLPDVLPEIRRSMSAFLDQYYDTQPLVNGMSSLLAKVTSYLILIHIQVRKYFLYFPSSVKLLPNQTP